MTWSARGDEDVTQQLHGGGGTRGEKEMKPLWWPSDKRQTFQLSDLPVVLLGQCETNMSLLSSDLSSRGDNPA